MKGAEAVSRTIQCNPLFYLSSFQIPFAETPAADCSGDFSVV